MDIEVTGRRYQGKQEITMTAQNRVTEASLRMRARQREIAFGYVLVGFGAALFSTKAILVKIAYAEAPDAVMLLALRMLFSLPLFAAIGVMALLRRRAEAKSTPDAKTFAAAIISGFIGYYVAAILDFQALTYITAQLERLVLFSYPLFVMILGAWFFGKRLTLGGTIGAIITYGGLALVFQRGMQIGGVDSAIGTLLVLAAALSFALYQLLAQGFIAKMGSLLFTSVAMSAAALAAILHYWALSGSLAFPVSAEFIGIAFVLALLATVLPSFLVNAGLARIGPQATSMISTLSPLITIILAVEILGEPFTLLDALGTALVIAGIGYYTWTDMRAQRLVTGE
jgi:drug/metabolite transporter (DMT)-like permease